MRVFFIASLGHSSIAVACVERVVTYCTYDIAHSHMCVFKTFVILSLRVN